MKPANTNDLLAAGLDALPEAEERHQHDLEEAARLLVAGQIVEAKRIVDRLLRPAAGSGLSFLSVAELDEPQGEPDWVVRALGICPGRPAAIIGVGSAGKSTFALLLAMQIQCGGRFLGHFFCPQADVVWLDFEMGRRATLRKMRRLCVAHGLDWQAVVARFRLAVYPRTFLNSPGAEEELTRAVAGARLCVVDSLRRSLPGVDENDSRIADYLQMLSRVSEETSCAFVVVHHDSTKINQSEKRDRRGAGRGSSAIYDGSGSYIVIDGPEGEPPRVTHVREPQEGAYFDPFHIRFEDVADGIDPKAGLRVAYLTPEQVKGPTDSRAAFHETMERVFRCVLEHPGIAGTEAIAETMGVRPVTIRAAVNQLKSDGRVVDRGPKGGKAGQAVKLYAVSG